MSTWSEVKNSTNIDFMWNSTHQITFEFFRSFVTQISAINVIGQSEGKLTIVKVIRSDFFIINALKGVVVSDFHFVITQPFEKELIWENSFIKDF